MFVSVLLLLLSRCMGFSASMDMDALFRELRKEQESGRKDQLASAWSSVLCALSERRSPALLYFCELMYHDGIELAGLHEERLALVLPPEIAEIDSEQVLQRVKALPRFSNRLWPKEQQDRDALTALRIRGSSVRTVECSDLSVAKKALETARRDGVPVLLKGLGGPDWQEWNSNLLADALPRAICRLATGSAVSFCRESHPLIANGIISAPSIAVSLTGKDALTRISSHQNEHEEIVYLQALAPRSLLDTKTTFNHRFGELFYSSRHEPPLPRIWACRGGVYSPLHYDAQDSILIQATGCKFMMLFPPEALSALDPVQSSDHPLARRCQLDILASSKSKNNFPPIVANSALEALLLPGDAIWFPSEWAHHTVALRRNDARHQAFFDDDNRNALRSALTPSSPDFSVSLSLREVDGRVVGA